MKRKSPHACPKCGSVAVIRLSGKAWSCQNDRCLHKGNRFPLLRNLNRASAEAVPIDGSCKGMASGCTMVRPTGNKYS